MAVAIPCLLIGLSGLGAEADRPTSAEPAHATGPVPPPSQKSPVRAPPPSTPAEQRPGASPPGPDAAAPPDPIEPPSLGPPSLEPARLAPPTEERAVVPAPTAPAPDEAEGAEQSARAEEPPRPRTAAELARAAAGTFVPAQGAALAIQLLERTLRSLDPRKLSAADLAQRLRRAPDELPAEATGATEAGTVAMASTGAAAVAAALPTEEGGMLDADALDRIRLEIKARLPYFQACADAARRRGSPDVRRLQAIWSVSADGAIKELKLENVDDAQLALCIVRMGSRPFTVKPGADLTIPTPIVFVR